MQEVFERVEKKYHLDKDKSNLIQHLLAPYVQEDEHFQSNIRSVYFDNDNYEMICRSIEKPYYKEKLRIRSYYNPDENEKVFVEIKKKLNGVVYKRRTLAKYDEVINDIYHCDFENKQIGNEIRYILTLHNQLKPMVYISANRISYRGKQDKQLRITFDDNMRYRLNDVSLRNSDSDKTIDDGVIMEIKANGSLPDWLNEILDKTNTYPSPFSKVGTALLKEIKENRYE